MLLKNKASRLIVINGELREGGYKERYRILCGDNPAVEVPDHLCESPSVKAWIEKGDLEVITQEKPKKKHKKQD